jgi:alkylhydroperoxidase family enzyme
MVANFSARRWSAPRHSRLCSPTNAKFHQVKDNLWERLHPDIPLPSPSSCRPTSKLGADTVAKLKPANDLNVARMLAGTAGMFDGAAGLVQAVFQAKDVDPKMRELIILRSAYLLDCPYEWQANILMAKNTGCTQEQIDAMTSQGPPTGLDDRTALVVLTPDEITESRTLTDATLQRLRDAYDDVICRKFILIIAWFNLLARFLNSCCVPLETGDKLGSRTSPLG